MSAARFTAIAMASPPAAPPFTAIGSWSGKTTSARIRAIDPAKWNFEINGKGGGNHELQYYTDSPKNARIENGELLITAIKNDAGHAFTSARMTTKSKFACRYGRIEAMIKVPKAQQGNWPAFWMMPQDSVYGGWPLR